MADTRVGDLIAGTPDSPLANALHPVVFSALIGLISNYVSLADINQSEITGNQLLAKVKSLPDGVGDFVLNKTVDPEALTADNDDALTQNLADIDPRGKFLRPLIAGTFCVMVFVAVVGYDLLLWQICSEAKRLPTFNEMLIPIIVPGFIVMSYFGFLKRDRRELLQMLLQRTPAGAVLTSVLQNAAVSSKSKSGN